MKQYIKGNNNYNYYFRIICKLHLTIIFILLREVLKVENEVYVLTCRSTVFQVSAPKRKIHGYIKPCLHDRFFL